MMNQDETVSLIAHEVLKRFPCFGSEQVWKTGRLSALNDCPPKLAGADVKEVVRFVLERAKELSTQAVEFPANRGTSVVESHLA